MEKKSRPEFLNFWIVPGIFKTFLWISWSFKQGIFKGFQRIFDSKGFYKTFLVKLNLHYFLVGRTILVLNSQALQMDFARESSSPLFYEISIVTLLLISVFFVNAIATAKAKPLIQISNEFSQKCLIASQKLKALKENWDISSHRHVKPTISELIISNTGCPNKF